MDTSPHKRAETGFFKDVWKAHNKLVDYCRSIAVAQSGNRGVVVHRTVNGTILNAESTKKSVSGPVVRALLKAVGADTWTAQLDSGELVQVAKPWTLRKTPFHNQTITYTDEDGATYTALFVFSSTSNRKRTVTINGGEVIEIQVIIPRPNFNTDYIWIAPCNETGVQEADYIDLNVDGRSWAKSD